MAFENVAFPDTEYKAPTAKEFQADRVYITSTSQAGHEWTNHRLAYSIKFDSNGTALSPVKVNKKDATVTVYKEGLLAEHFDGAVGDAAAFKAGWTVDK